MRYALIAAIVLVGAVTNAHANCADDINTALDQARALPPSSGKPFVLENIERARNDHHENDEQGCQEKIDEVLAMLKQHRDAVAAAASQTRP